MDDCMTTAPGDCVPEVDINKLRAEAIRAMVHRRWEIGSNWCPICLTDFDVDGKHRYPPGETGTRADCPLYRLEQAEAHVRELAEANTPVDAFEPREGE